jgi:hypothetical protein
MTTVYVLGHPYRMEWRELERRLLSIDHFGMRKLPPTAAEDLLEISMRRYAGRRLGQATRRRGRSECDARPSTASRPRDSSAVPVVGAPKRGADGPKTRYLLIDSASTGCGKTPAGHFH